MSVTSHWLNTPGAKTTPRARAVEARFKILCEALDDVLQDAAYDMPWDKRRSLAAAFKAVPFFSPTSSGFHTTYGRFDKDLAELNARWLLVEHARTLDAGTGGHLAQSKVIPVFLNSLAEIFTIYQPTEMERASALSTQAYMFERLNSETTPVRAWLEDALREGGVIEANLDEGVYLKGVTAAAMWTGPSPRRPAPPPGASARAELRA